MSGELKPVSVEEVVIVIPWPLRTDDEIAAAFAGLTDMTLEKAQAMVGILKPVVIAALIANRVP